MDPTEFAWRTLESISNKRPKEIKLLMDSSIACPRLERDDAGYVIRLDCPRISSPHSLTLHGMYFDNTEEGRLALWKMFRASVMHLSLHSAVTDFEI